MGTRVEIISRDGAHWAGTLVPAHELSGDRIVQLKLDSGYNVGVRIEPGDQFRTISNGSPESNGSRKPPSARHPPAGETVALLTTGGTIASRVDYRTGGVKPVRDEAEILEFYPDLDRDGPVRIVPVFDRLSEEIAPADWLTLAHRVADEFGQGAKGIVIAHGTDTLAYTSAALSFLVHDPPGPVVLVGAQRSPDRPSSDGFTNMAAAVSLARHTELAEVVVVMHAGLSDDKFAVHRGTRVRKMHSSRRDAFQTRNAPPLGTLDASGIHLTEPFRTRSGRALRVEPRIGERGGLLWFYPGMDPGHAAAFAADLRGIVLAGTGLGHVSSAHLPWIRSKVGEGALVAMTTQCLAGSADPYVYATGRELLRAGVLYLGDLLPETAYAKLLWALGRTEDPAELRRLMTEDQAGEFESRHVPTGPV